MTGHLIDDYGIDVTGDERLHGEGELLEGLNAAFIKILGRCLVVGCAGLGAQDQRFVIGNVFDAFNAILINADQQALVDVDVAHRRSQRFQRDLR